MANEIVRLERNGFQVEFSKDRLINLTDLWKMAGSPEEKRPADWGNLKPTKELIRKVKAEVNAGKSGIKVIDSKRGKGSGTLAHYKLALEYAGYLDVEFKSWCLEQLARLLAEPEEFAADILIRSHNKEKIDRAKKRLLCSETNKQTAEIAHSAGLSIGKVHNDRYNGLYRKTASQLRKEAGLKPDETPLDVMSSRDLQMNSLANILAIEANDADLVFDFANDMRESYQKRMGKELTPMWEQKLLRPSQAKAIAFADYQHELPLNVQ